MASIKVSELPAVTSITPEDVLIINDENLTTSSIKISLFTSSFTGQNLTFTGTSVYNAAVTFATASLPTFNSATVFNENVTFNGSIILGAAAQIPLGALSDVTLANTVPTGNVLTWNQSAGQWENAVTGSMNNVVDDTNPTLGGDLDVNGYEIISEASQTGPNGANIVINPNGAGVVIFEGNSTRGSGQFKLNCEATTHGITIKGPNHAAAASYTFIFPPNMGNNGEALLTNGTSGTSWAPVLQQSVNNNLPDHADDSAASAGGVPIGGIYRTGGDVRVRIN